MIERLAWVGDSSTAIIIAIGESHMKKSFCRLGFVLLTLVSTSAFANQDPTPTPAPEPRVLISGTETNASRNPTQQNEVICSVDETGAVVITKNFGFDEDEKPLKTERTVKSKLDATTMVQLKTQLTGASVGLFLPVAYACNVGTTVVQGLDFSSGEYFDIFVARNCMDSMINTQPETQILLKSLRSWCGMRLVRPDGAVSRR